MSASDRHIGATAGRSAAISGDPGLFEVPLHRIAHGRAGDKGDRLNVSVIAYRPEHYPLIREQVTAERVHELFAHRGATRVERYELPRLWALNFVIDDVLEGGVNDALNLDGHGKSNSFLVLALTVQLPGTDPAARDASARADRAGNDSRIPDFRTQRGGTGT